MYSSAANIAAPSSRLGGGTSTTPFEAWVMTWPLTVAAGPPTERIAVPTCTASEFPLTSVADRVKLPCAITYAVIVAVGFGREDAESGDSPEITKVESGWNDRSFAL